MGLGRSLSQGQPFSLTSAGLWPRCPLLRCARFFFAVFPASGLFFRICMVFSSFFVVLIVLIVSTHKIKVESRKIKYIGSGENLQLFFNISLKFMK